MLKLRIWKLMGIAIGTAALLILTMPAGSAQGSVRGYKSWTWGPPTCVHVRNLRSRQTRYAGAPRCRRVPA